jgi:hypothetical protein
MVISNKQNHSQDSSAGKGGGEKLKKLLSMGEISNGIVNELYSPIDSTNRFINLALQSIGENPQGRQFLLESKEGIRKMAILLQKLKEHTEMIESEIREISGRDE